MSIFERFFVKSSSHNTTPVQKRQLRLETLESRELLSVNPLGIDTFHEQDSINPVFADAAQTAPIETQDVPEIAASIPSNANAADTAWLNNFLTAHTGLTDSIATWTNGRITSLNLDSKGLTGTLDVSGLTNLQYLNCCWNNLSVLDVSKNTALTELYCSQNGMKLLYLSKAVSSFSNISYTSGNLGIEVFVGSPPETDAIGDSISTAYNVSSTNNAFSSSTQRIGDGAYGAKDVDMYKITVAAADVGKAFTFQTAAVSGQSTVDTYIRLFNSSGTQLGYNDDHTSSDYRYSLLTWTPTAAGTYYLGVSSYGNRSYNPTTAGSGIDGSTGYYTLNITRQAVVTQLPTPTLSTGSVTASSVALSWSSVSNASSYTLQRSASSTFSSYTTLTSGSTGRTYTDTDVTAGTTYYYRVKAVGTGNYTDSEYSETVPVTINAVASLGIPQVTLSQSNGNVTLSWAAIPTATHYGVYRMVNGKWTVVNANVTATTFTENNVPAGTQTYAVRAFKSTTMSDYQTGVTINIVPAGLGVPQVTPTKSNGKVTLTWSVITGADRYGVYRLVNSKWTLLTYVTATTFTESNVPAGLQTYAVRAFKGTTMSDYQTGVTIIL